MDTNIITGALNAAGHQAAAGAVVIAVGAIVLLTIAWIAASFCGRESPRISLI